MLPYSAESKFAPVARGPLRAVVEAQARAEVARAALPRRHLAEEPLQLQAQVMAQKLSGFR